MADAQASLAPAVADARASLTQDAAGEHAGPESAVRDAASCGARRAGVASARGCLDELDHSGSFRPVRPWRRVRRWDLGQLDGRARRRKLGRLWHWRGVSARARTAWA
jgi:hypothetical protein